MPGFMPFFRSLRLIGLCLVIIEIRSLSAESGELEKNRFLSDYVEASAKIEDRFARLRGTCRISRQSIKNGKFDLIDDATFNIDHGISKVSILRSLKPGETGDRPEFVYCIAPDYAFTVVRAPGEKTFEVRSLGADRTDRTSFTNKCGRYLFAPFRILGHSSLSELMRFDGFEIVSAELSEPDRFDLEYLIGSSVSKDRVKLKLDPTKGWVITRGQIVPASLGGKNSLEFQIEYQDDEPIPLPKRVVYHDVTGLDTVCEFTSISTEPTDLKEFAMSHYGLPDMTGPGRIAKSVRIPVLACLAFFSAIVGVILKYRAKRSLAGSA